MKSVNLPDDLESPNDKFFTHPVVEWLLTNAGTTENIDWNEVYNPKNKDNKFEGYTKRLLEITNGVVTKGGKGYFWIVCSPNMSDHFRSMKSVFVGDCLDQFPLGYPVVLYMGTVDKRWRIYSDLALHDNMMLMGCCFSRKHVNYYCKINVTNYK